MAGEQIPQGKYGRERDYNIDLVPKFMMTAGELVSILVHTDVTRYLDFQQIGGSYVYIQGKGMYKVPASVTEAASTSLLGFMDRTKAVRFMHYVKNADPDNPTTWEGWDLNRMTMAQVFYEYGLGSGPQDMIGHALALHHDESYLECPAIETFRRIRLYMLSLVRFGKSPYIYPMYGLGELPQGFARLSAIYGGTYMLNKPVDEILYDPSGRVCGVRSGPETALCKAIVCDPTYVPDRVKKVHRIIRVICLLNSPIPHTDNSDSVQIILPRRQLSRKSGTSSFFLTHALSLTLTPDIYIACVSSVHHVSAKGFYVAIVSTIIETDDPMREVQPALDLLGPIVERFNHTTYQFEPIEDGSASNLFITRSLDASSHFESVCDDVKSVYQRLTGHQLTLKQRPSAEEEQAAAERQFSQSQQQSA